MSEYRSLKDLVLEQLDAVPWSSIDVDTYRDHAFQAVADGIYSYLTNEPNRTVICAATGAITPPGPPAPYAGPALLSLTWPPAATIKTQLLAQTLGVPAGDVSAFFTVLASLPVVATITSWDPDTVGTLTGAGTAVFSAMAAQAAAATTAMQTQKPATRDAAWTLIQQYVVLGLTSGIVTIPACTGTAGTSAFTGAATGTVTYE